MNQAKIFTETVNFDVKTSHKAMGHPLRKKPLVRNIRHRFAQLRYIAKGVTRLFVKIYYLFLETQVRLLIFCMLRIKAEIQIEPLAINELHLLRELKIQILSVKSPQYTFGKSFSNQKKRVYFQLKDMITFNFYDQKRSNRWQVFFTNDTAIHFITERSPLTLSYSTCSLYNDFFQLKQLRSLLA